MTTNFKIGTHEEVLAANRELSARAAETYNESEPHYLPENIQRVSSKLDEIIESSGRTRMLDLGCGTGFMIDIARTRVERIHGIDISPEMINRVNLAGPAEVTVQIADTATVNIDHDTYDIVTAYSFLHHLFDPKASLATAARALRPGGKLYVDLEPNRYFWSAISMLDRSDSYDEILEREIAMVVDHHGVALKAGVDPGVFELAEWGKTRLGGLEEGETRATLGALGFWEVHFFYEWFVGQGLLINDPGRPRRELLSEAEVIGSWLHRAHPMSRSLFKYVGFTATKR